MLLEVRRVVYEETLKIWDVSVVLEDLIEDIAQIFRYRLYARVRDCDGLIDLVASQGPHINKLCICVDGRDPGFGEVRLHLEAEVVVGRDQLGVMTPETTVGQLRRMHVRVVVLSQQLQGCLQVDRGVTREQLGAFFVTVEALLGSFAVTFHVIKDVLTSGNHI